MPPPPHTHNYTHDNICRGGHTETRDPQPQKNKADKTAKTEHTRHTRTKDNTKPRFAPARRHTRNARRQSRAHPLPQRTRGRVIAGRVKRALASENGGVVCDGVPAHAELNTPTSGQAFRRPREREYAHVEWPRDRGIHITQRTNAHRARSGMHVTPTGEGARHTLKHIALPCTDACARWPPNRTHGVHVRGRYGCVVPRARY